jgi:hypothetical protein
MNHSYVDNLSKSAREEIGALAQKMEAIAAADQVREPKLTPEEKSEIATAAALLEKYRPVNEKLLNLIQTKDARLKFLELNSQKIIIDGDDVDALVSELALLKPALQLLEETRRATMMECAIAENKIKKIKENARVREIREEVKNEQ